MSVLVIHNLFTDDTSKVSVLKFNRSLIKLLDYLLIGVPYYTNKTSNIVFSARRMMQCNSKVQQDNMIRAILFFCTIISRKKL